jgi:phosphoglycerate dehydrogenase-like enzyme
MSVPWSVLALPPLDRSLLEHLFADLGVELIVPVDRTPGAARAAVAGADIVVGDWSGVLRVSAELLDAAPRLAFVHQPSVGMDTIDVPACTARGVPVANAGTANAISVAEWCVGAALAALRSLAHADREVRAGRWPQLELSRRGGGELSSRRVGIVGMGGIARECARRFGALGCDVAYWSRNQRSADGSAGAYWLPFEELLARSDIVVVMIALADQTRGLLGADQLALLPKGAFLINAARGGIVDENALLAAVRSGAMAGGALDVYATEPLPADSPLFDEDRLLLSPHAAGATHEAQGRLLAGLVENLRRAISGEPVADVVNASALAAFDGVIRRRGA